jgi:hypothetical protein
MAAVFMMKRLLKHYPSVFSQRDPFGRRHLPDEVIGARYICGISKPP